jgi:hypothetical protein
MIEGKEGSKNSASLVLAFWSSSSSDREQTKYINVISVNCRERICVEKVGRYILISCS